MSEQKTLIEEFGLTNLPAEERDILITELGEVVFAGVLQKVWSDLDLDKQDALTALLHAIEEKPEDESRQASLVQFLETQAPDYREHVVKEIDAFRKKYKEMLGELQ